MKSPQIGNYYGDSELLRRSIFSTAGSFGYLEVAKRTKYSEDRGLKVRFSLATIAFDRESAQMSQMLSSQGKNAASNPYPHFLVRLATSR